jgi:hypothetical protein
MVLLRMTFLLSRDLLLLLVILDWFLCKRPLQRAPVRELGADLQSTPSARAFNVMTIGYALALLQLGEAAPAGAANRSEGSASHHLICATKAAEG